MMEKKEASVLIVEDEDMVSRLLKRTLERRYTHVHFARNGQEALEIMEEESIDLVLTDLNMPKMNGFVFLEKLQPKRDTVKIVIVSAYNYAEEDEGKLAYDFLDENGYKKYVVDESMYDAYFKKPFNAPVVIEKLDELLG